MAKPQTTEANSKTEKDILNLGPNWPVKRIYLQSAAIIDSKTEQRIDVQNFPGVTIVGYPWGAKVYTQKEKHTFHGAQIKDMLDE